MNKVITSFAAIGLCAVFASSAQACKVVGYKNGEPLCASKSDAGAQQYKPAHVPKAVEAKRIHDREVRERRRFWEIRRKWAAEGVGSELPKGAVPY